MSSAQPDSVTLYRAIGGFIAKALADALRPVIARLEEVERRAPERGEKGEPGRDGKDGIDGRVGKDGATGRDGSDGKDGINGTDGERGEAGREGPAGRDGRDGLPGTSGKDGLNGKDGRDGIDGKDGGPGLNGKDGADGLGWDELIIDYDGERSFTFVSLLGDQRREHGTYKMPFMIYRGVFKDGETYERGDTVTWGGSLWHAHGKVSEKPNLTTKWQLACKKGENGKDGDKGPSGERGPQGSPGLDRR